MGGSTVGRARGDTCPPRFLEANVKSLIFTIDAPRFITFTYCAPPLQILMSTPAYEYGTLYMLH